MFTLTFTLFFCSGGFYHRSICLDYFNFIWTSQSHPTFLLSFRQLLQPQQVSCFSTGHVWRSPASTELHAVGRSSTRILFWRTRGNGGQGETKQGAKERSNELIMTALARGNAKQVGKGCLGKLLSRSRFVWRKARDQGTLVVWRAKWVAERVA